MVPRDRRRTGVPRGARLDPETRRAQILEAACELLETHGVEAMTIEDVADVAGVSRSLVYTYFGDRDGMVAEVYLRVLDQVDGAVPLGMPSDRAVMVGRIADCLRFAREHPAAWRLLVTDSVRRHPAVKVARERRVGRLTANGEGAAVPLLADAALGFIEAGVLHWVDRQSLPVEKAAGVLATLLWTGLAGLPGSSQRGEGQRGDGQRGDGRRPGGRKQTS
jgi:AcrR family transcriptional regulator